MRKFWLVLSTCILSYSSLSANCCEGFLPADCSSGQWPSAFNVEAGAGFRRDRFNWSIAGPNPDNFPNVLSKLKWSDLRSVLVGGQATYVSCRNYAIKVSGDYGHIYHGSATDSDYGLDEANHLFLQSKSEAGKGHVYDLSAGGGYRITSTYGRFIAIPMAGFSWHGQDLHMYDGRFTVNTISGVLGPFPGLDSTYNARWYGPWAGLDFQVKVERCAYLFGGFEMHYFTYRGDGQWNLRQDIGEFWHKAIGWGYIAKLGGSWEIWHNWSIGVIGNYRFFRTHHGTDTTEILNIPGIHTVRTRFNRAELHSASVSALIAWRF